MIPLAKATNLWLVAAGLYLLVPILWDLAARWSGRWTGRPAGWPGVVARPPLGEWLRVSGRLLYSVAIPYAMLLAGIADARSLGVAGFPRWPELPLGTAVGLGGVLLVMWSWGRIAAMSDRRGPRHRPLLGLWKTLHLPHGWVHLAFDVLCLQGSWAFVRGAAIRLVGLYAGVWLGLAASALAWLLRPGQAASLADAEARAPALLSASLALVTGLAFLYAENLWLCLAVHALGLLAACQRAAAAYGETG